MVLKNFSTPIKNFTIIVLYTFHLITLLQICTVANRSATTYPCVEIIIYDLFSSSEIPKIRAFDLFTVSS